MNKLITRSFSDENMLQKIHQMARESLLYITSLKSKRSDSELVIIQKKGASFFPFFSKNIVYLKESPPEGIDGSFFFFKESRNHLLLCVYADDAFWFVSCSVERIAATQVQPPPLSRPPARL